MLALPAYSPDEWVAQVSLLRPGCSGQDSFARRNPGLKSDTWATRQSAVDNQRLRCPHRDSGCAISTAAKYTAVLPRFASVGLGMQNAYTVLTA